MDKLSSNFISTACRDFRLSHNSRRRTPCYIDFQFPGCTADRLSLICRHENVPGEPLVVAQAGDRPYSRTMWSCLQPVNFFSFLATDDFGRFLVWVRSIARAQNDRYLVLTCRRFFCHDSPG